MEMTWKKIRVRDQGCRGCVSRFVERSSLSPCNGRDETRALVNADRSGVRSLRSITPRLNESLGRDHRSLVRSRENGIPAIC